jgi:hypothetical protein
LIHLFRGAALIALLAAPGCSHHHWERSGSSHEDSHRELERCAATAGGSAISVEDCMEEKGYSIDPHHFGPPSARPALEAIPRLPGR